ncbi:MAG: hypothetical protein QM751_01195 [Paludibacteraceae bacterium]
MAETLENIGKETSLNCWKTIKIRSKRFSLMTLDLRVDWAGLKKK